MSGRCGEIWGRWVWASFLLVALAWVGVGCGSPGSISDTPGAGATVASPAALATPTAVATDRPNLPAAEVIAVLEGRIAAMNGGDGVGRGLLHGGRSPRGDPDPTPHGLPWAGRARVEVRRSRLPRPASLAPAGAPIAYDRYVAEPTRFYDGTMPGRGAGMLVFEIGPGSKLAYQWMIGWAGGPEATFAIGKSPSAGRPNLPPRRVAKILEGRMAAMNRGDGRAAAADHAGDGKDGGDEGVSESRHLGAHGHRCPARGPARNRACASRRRLPHHVLTSTPPSRARLTETARTRRGDARLRASTLRTRSPTSGSSGGWTSTRTEKTATAAATSSPVGVGPGEIAFTKGTGGDGVIQADGIYVVHADGTGLDCPCRRGRARNPAWSPDGTSIADFDGRGVNVINADGSGSGCPQKPRLGGAGQGGSRGPPTARRSPSPATQATRATCISSTPTAAAAGS